MIRNKKLDQQYFSECISRFHGRLYKHALWMTGNRDIAADMVQEAYYQAWQALSSLKDRDKILPWLLTILRRVIYREQRCAYRNAETMAQLSQIEQTGKQADGHPLLEIYAALANLSPNQREVFLLFHLHGYQYEEISEQLEIPIGTVMSRLSRARNALQKFEREENKIIQLSDIKRGALHDG